MRTLITRTTLTNPFTFGRVVGGDDFCPRPKLVSALKGFVDQGQSCAVIGERRVGKTSLIFEAIRRSKVSRVVYTDLLEIKTTDDFVCRLARALVLLENKEGWLTRTLSALSFLRPTVTFDPTSGSPSVSVDAARSSRPETLEAVLEVVGDLRTTRKLVLVFDEFQDVTNLTDHRSVLAVFRSKIQFHGTTPYLFSGSVRGEMELLFSDPDSPLFKSAATLAVGPIERTAFARFVEAKLKQHGRTISPAALAQVFDLAHDTPGDVQQLLSALWTATEGQQRIERDGIAKALEVIYASELKGYELSLASVTGTQLHVLATLARLGPQKPTGTDFLRAAGATQASSVQRALASLVKKRILFTHGGCYRFINPFFAAWLLRKGL